MPTILLLIGIIIMLSPQTLHAEVVSIQMQTDGNEGLLVEAAMKKQLREEGYTVRTATNDGIVLLLSVMRPTTRQGPSPGYLGHVSVVSMQWQSLADMLVSDNCKEDHATAQDLKDLLGTRAILIDGVLATAATPDELANILITYANPSIRKSFRTMQAFFEKVEMVNKRNQQSEVLNPMR